MEYNNEITIETTVNKPITTVWELWTQPQHITQWNNASPDWHTPLAENDLRVGGLFNFRMEAKDGSFGFNFCGKYTAVEPNKHIAYTIEDNRKVDIKFTGVGDTTEIVETFEAENENPVDMQRGGWQAILDNFKAYAEAN